MKRSQGPGTTEAPLISQKNPRKSYYIEEDMMYSIHDRIVRYTPNVLNDKIVTFAPALQFQKDASLLVDFSINDEICVYVRRIDLYMRQPEEIFKLVERQKQREERTGKAYVLRVFILILDNLASNEQIVEQLSAKCAHSDLSLLVCWGSAEAGSLITEIKTYEKRGMDIIRKQMGTDLLSQATNVLKSIDGINIDNAQTLIGKYATMSDIMTAKISDLEDIPGMGARRVLNLVKAFQHVKEETDKS